MSRRANRTTRLVRAVAAALVGAVVLSGCDFDVYSLPASRRHRHRRRRRSP